MSLDADSTTAAAVDLVVNGTPVTVSGSHPHLLSALRDELNVTSPKDGCSPSGQCGCCTVMIDGKAQVSCQYPIEKARGKTITTLEGLSDDERATYANAFARTGNRMQRVEWCETFDRTDPADELATTGSPQVPVGASARRGCRATPRRRRRGAA